VSPNTSVFRFIATAAGWMLAAPLLCGCFLRTDVPLQPIPPTPAAHDPPEKGLIHGPKPASPAKDEALSADSTTPAGIRRKLATGGWYRTPLTAEESATGVYNEALAKADKTQSQATAFHYRHAGVEQLLARPADARAIPAELLRDSDRNVAATAAIALARQGDVKVAGRLTAAVADE